MFLSIYLRSINSFNAKTILTQQAFHKIVMKFIKNYFKIYNRHSEKHLLILPMYPWECITAYI